MRREGTWIKQTSIATLLGEAIVPAAQPGKFGRYIDTYERRGGEWRCVHACVWPLQRNG
jgi:hypothetical protein